MSFLTAEPARAHVNVQPRLVERGIVTTLAIELPLLRPGAPPEQLEIAGRGIDVRSSSLTAVAGTETRWSVRLRADSPPGELPIVLRAIYPDGSAVDVDESLTVVPAEDSAGAFPWAAVVAGVLVAAGSALVALRVARRRTW